MTRAIARRQLSPDRVVRVALDVLDEEGFDGLSMRTLAARLGVQAASLYNHVRDKSDLLALMADALCAEVESPDTEQPWRQQLEWLARQVRRVLTAHRDGARVLAATPPLGPNRLRLMEHVLFALRVSAGLPPGRAAEAASILNSYVVGFVLDESDGTPRDAAAARRVREHTRRSLRRLPKERFPTLVALCDHLVDSPPERRFELGLGALLDGFGGRATRKR